MHRDNLHLLEEGQGMPREELDERIAREEFRRPRESLLNICTEFYKHCGPRLKILQNVAGEPRVTALELLDIKSHMRYEQDRRKEAFHVPSICCIRIDPPILSRFTLTRRCFLRSICVI